jgi:hypothetical protein
MTQQSGPSMPTSRRTAWELGLLVLLPVTLSASLLFTAYYLIPTKSAGEGSDAPWLILELCAFGVVVGIQVQSRYQLSSRRSTPSSARSRHWRSSFRSTC